MRRNAYTRNQMIAFLEDELKQKWLKSDDYRNGYNSACGRIKMMLESKIPEKGRKEE